MRYDVAVVGLGGMGSATLAHAARRGVACIGVERYARLHDQGASSGETRIIRKAYFEHPSYVPLLERAYALWHELEAQTGRTLTDFVGILMVGAPEREGIAGTLLSARTHGLPLTQFDAAQIERHFPGTRPRPGEIGLLERDAGIVFPEATVGAHLDVAAAHGAAMRFECALTGWNRRAGFHELVLSDGSTIEAARVVFCPGMWTVHLLAELQLPLRVQRNVQVWFEPSTAQYDRGLFPTFFLERLELPAPLYGFPAIGGCLKAALHHFGDTVDPERPERRIRDADVTIVRDALDEWIPGAAAAYVRGKVCTYTLTPDGNFVLGHAPGDSTVTLACGFSGHGFKFSPVIGEIAAQLAIDGGTPLDIGFLSPERFIAAAP